jgi:5-methylcytosine-specific restriction endonuclease McrA
MKNKQVRDSVKCKGCGVIYTPGRTCTGVYCSIQCQADTTHAAVISSWLTGELEATNKSGQLRNTIRTWVKERDKYKCVMCGWNEINPVSGKSPLEVDHIDGDHANGDPLNLRTICPNCHSLTPTWKNTGNKSGGKRGRAYRRN